MKVTLKPMSTTGLAYWKSGGPGTPIVFLHGLLRNRNCFSPLFPAVAPRHGIFSVDHGGHGESPRLASYRVVDHLPGLVEFLRGEISGRPAILYGHSMGAMLAAALAARHPDLVHAAILEDPPFHTMGNRLAGTALHDYFRAIRPVVGTGLPASELARVRVDGQTLGQLREPSQLRFLSRCFAEADPGVLDPVLNGSWLDGYDPSEVWRNLSRATLVLQSDPAAGGMLTDDDAAAFVSSAGDATLVRLSGIGHQAHWQDAPAVTRHLLAFLGSLD
jgi:pimeloyl-ACP methyl ester carboxylesterase